MSGESIQNTYSKLSRLGEVFIIFIVRRQDLWLASSWAQQIKTGKIILTPQEFIMDNLDSRGNFYSIATKWSKWFGKENFKVLVLEKSQIKDHIFLEFLRACNFQDVKKIVIPESKNISLSMKTLTIIQNIVKSAGLFDTDFSTPAGKAVRLVMKYSKKNKWNKKKLSLIDSKLFTLIHEQFSESNKKIAREYLDREELFLDEFIEEPIDKNDLSIIEKDELIEVMVFLIKKLQKTKGTPNQNRLNSHRKIDIVSYKNILRTWISRGSMAIKHMNIYFLYKTPDLFDAEWYLSENPSVHDYPPYIHYLRYGYKEGRDPNPHFSIRYYLKYNPKIARRGTEPLFHYLKSGWKNGFNPNPNFNIKKYLEQQPGVQESGIEPLSHFLSRNKK